MAPRTLTALHALNPLSCRGTALPPPLLVLAKMYVIVLVAFGRVLRVPTLPFLPFLRVFDDVAPSTTIQHAVQIAMIGSMLGILFNRAVRLACFGLGASILTAILLSRTYWSDGHAYTGLMLVLLGLYEPTRGLRLVRAQVVLLYLAAGASKLLQPDWQSGQFMSSWVDFMGRSRYQTPVSTQLYPWLEHALQPHSLPAIMGAMAITTELAIGIGLVYRPRWAIPLGIVFHGSLTLLAGITFGEFLFVVAGSYIVFAQWPKRVIVTYDPYSKAQSVLCRVMSALDADGLLTFDMMTAPAPLYVRVDGTRFIGAPAVFAALRHVPASYLLACAALVSAKVLSTSSIHYRLDFAIGLTLIAGAAVCSFLASGALRRGASP